MLFHAYDHCSCLKRLKIQSVAVTPGYVGTSPNANPSLEVTWSAVDDPAVSYVVRYSRSMGTVTAPPDGANEMSVNGNSVTLSDNLAPDKQNTYTYYIWVAATSRGVPMGEYSDRASGVTLYTHYTVSYCSTVCCTSCARDCSIN